MKELKGTKTLENLMAAFAGESMATNKYAYFASKAKKDGFNQIAAIFEETSGNEESGENIFGEFEAQTLDGEDVTQEIFGQSKLTMINIWGTFCGPCIQEMPDLGEISRSYDSGEFQMIGLISDVTETGDSKAQEIVQSTQADYTHLVASPDIQRKVLSRVSVVPTTIFVDSEGNQVGEGYAGSRSKEEWTSIIEDLRSEVQ